MSQDHDPAGSDTSFEPLLEAAPVGRRFVGERKVRLGDVDRSGRLRLDALTRYTQDVSDDDTTDAGLPAEPGWVVRSTVVDEIRPANIAETITCVTFCSALGKRWAERRLSITGDAGARYEVATLWVCIDAAAARPVALTEEFLELYAEASAGRSVSAKLLNPKPSTFPADRLVERRWSLRVADYDIYDHVNNAAYWAVVEEWGPAKVWPRRIRMEYGQGVSPTESVPVVTNAEDGGSKTMLWWLDENMESATLASASVDSLPDDLYR